MFNQNRYLRHSKGIVQILSVQFVPTSSYLPSVPELEVNSTLVVAIRTSDIWN